MINEEMRAHVKYLEAEMRKSNEFSAKPLPPSTLTNADGTPYAAGHDPEMKRFLLKPEGRSGKTTLEGVIFSDGMIVVHDAPRQVSILTEDDVKQRFPGAWVIRLD